MASNKHVLALQARLLAAMEASPLTALQQINRILKPCIAMTPCDPARVEKEGVFEASGAGRVEY